MSAELQPALQVITPHGALDGHMLLILGIMIVTGPTVIAPLLRQARLQTHPAQALHWEAIVNDALGALAAVLAVLVVLVRHSHLDGAMAVWVLTKGVGFAGILGLAGGYGIVGAFRRNLVPEYMKVPVLFVTGYAGDASEDEAFGDHDVLRKPFTLTALDQAIRRSNAPAEGRRLAG